VNPSAGLKLRKIERYISAPGTEIRVLCCPAH